MKNRVELTVNERQSAVLRCRDIEAALHALLFDVLDGKAHPEDTNEVTAIMQTLRSLRERFENEVLVQQTCEALMRAGRVEFRNGRYFAVHPSSTSPNGTSG
jgi:hypothetical protein